MVPSRSPPCPSSGVAVIYVYRSINPNDSSICLFHPSLSLVQSFSGCKDSQTSADTSEAGKATGAMSFAFIAALTNYPQVSFQQLLCNIREELKGKVRPQQNLFTLVLFSKVTCGTTRIFASPSDVSIHLLYLPSHSTTKSHSFQVPIPWMSHLPGPAS